MKNKAAKRRLIPSAAAAAGSVVVCFSGSDISCASAFQISGLSSFPTPTSIRRSVSFTSPSNRSRLYVTSFSYEEQQQQYQQEMVVEHDKNAQENGEEESSYFEQHPYSDWESFDNDDGTSWFPITNSIIEEFARNRQMMVVEEDGIEEWLQTNHAHAIGNADGEEMNSPEIIQEGPSTTTSTPTSTEKLLDSLKPSPIDAVTNQDIEENFLRMVSNEVNYKKFLGQSPYALTDIKFPVLLQRFLDNLEDGTQKNNGKFKGQNKVKKKDQPREERKTVVVLGTGWASHAFVKLASTYDLRIVVVSPVNHFVFT